jgi:hypothetical protein
MGNSISTGRLVVITALATLLAGLFVGAFWSSRQASQRERAWKAERAAEFQKQQTTFADSMAALQKLISDRELVIHQLTLNEHQALRNVKIYTDSIRIYRIGLATATTLEDCRERADKLATACETALAHADTARIAADGRATMADSIIGEERERTRLALERLTAVNTLLNAAPVGQKKWLGFLPPPVVVLGVGCSIGLKAGCGLSVVAGFPIF